MMETLQLKLLSLLQVQKNDVYELEVVKATVPGLDSNNEVYDIHFVTKDGKIRQIKQPASIKVPVERKVISAYQIDKDGTNKQNIETSQTLQKIMLTMQ